MGVRSDELALPPASCGLKPAAFTRGTKGSRRRVSLPSSVPLKFKSASSEGDRMFRCSVLLRLTTLSIAFGFLVMGAPISSVWSGEAAKPAELPIGRGLTQRLANFTLKDVTTGRNITLYDCRLKSR